MALSKQQFKSFVQKNVEEKALKYLNDIKRSHSKVSHIQHTRLEAQAYLAPENVIDIQLSKFIFQARSRMLDLIANFKQKDFSLSSK